MFPERITNYIKNAAYTMNDVGLSGSRVYIFDRYVLKVQPKSEETDNEFEILNWLDGACPAPKILEYVKEDRLAYTLMTKIGGEMLCDEKYMKDPQRLIALAAQALRMLWTVDVKDCPCSFSRLDRRLAEARKNVENGTVDMDDAESETFGPGGFADPAELLQWLENNRPEEDLVLTHGDFCLPNVFAQGDEITGFIDNGKMGPADRWQDISILLRSLQRNFNGKYTGGVPYEGYEDSMLLDALGIEMDPEKNRYYMLLDELF